MHLEITLSFSNPSSDEQNTTTIGNPDPRMYSAL